MLRIWVVLALCVKGEEVARCSCDVSSSSVSEPSSGRVQGPPRVITSGQGASPTDSATIQALENLGEGVDPSEVVAKLLEAGGELLKQVLEGDSFSQEQILDDVDASVVAVLKLANPILGAIAGLVFSFFEALGGTETDPYRELYDQIMGQVKEMIQESFIKSSMDDVANAVVSAIADNEFEQRIGNEPNIQFYVDHMIEVFNRYCWGGAFLEQECINWEQAGSVAHSIQWASLHMQSLTQILADNSNNATAVDIWKKELQIAGDNYVPLLRHSLQTFYDHRMHQFGVTYYQIDGVSPPTCWNHQGWCQAYPQDLFTSGSLLSGCPSCHTCIVEDSEEPYKSETIAWHNAFGNCVTTYRAKLQKVMDGFAKSIDRLDQMRAIAHGWAVPASVGVSFSSVFYGPKHTSDGNLRILGEGQTMLSESGTYMLILQTDHNLVLYENRVDGLTSWSSKSAIWHVQGGTNSYLELQVDGNFVFYSDDGVHLSGNCADNKLDKRFVVQNDGNIVVYGADNSVSWARNGLATV